MRAWVVVALGAAIGCGGAAGAGKGGPGGSGGESAGGQVRTFEPGPPLEEPPPGDPETPGYPYLADLYEPLQSRWRSFLGNCRTQLPPEHPLNQSSLQVVVDIGVGRDGRLRAVQVVQPSGNGEFDDVAVEVVRDAAPFPPPPASFVSDDSRVHVTWTFARDRRQAGLAGARLDRVQWKPSRAVPMLLEAGMDAEAARRVADAAEPLPADDQAAALIDLNDAIAVHAIAGALGAPDPGLARAAVEAAGRGRVGQVSKQLAALATGGAEPGVRLAAIEALGNLDTESAWAVLTALAESEQATDEERLAAVKGLARGESADTVRPVAVALADDSAPDRRLLGLAMLAHVPAPGRLEAIVRLAGSGAVTATRAAALMALGRLAAAGGTAGRGASRTLLDALSSRNAALRVAVADAVANAADYGYDQRMAYWKVIELLKDRDERVRAAAVRAGAALGKQRFARELFRLRKERSSVVLLALARALARVDATAAADRLAGLARDGAGEQRLAAVRSLVALEKSAALVAFVSDDSPSVRSAAMTGIDDVNAVESALDDPSIEVRAAAVGRLGSLRGRLGALRGASRLMSASDPAGRVVIAGAWLGTRGAGTAP